MKNLKLLFFSFAIIGTLFMTSCTDDPTCTDGLLNGTETEVDCGGDCDPCPTCDDGIQNGDEEGVDCGGLLCDVCPVGLENTSWAAVGTGVAQRLRDAFMTDSISANFNMDGTFAWTQHDPGANNSTLTGNYVQEASEVDGIWNITMEVTAPGSATLVGIYEITTGTMMFEIAQTDPNVGETPPTATEGFGSTLFSGTNLGDINVHTFEQR